MSDRRPSTPRKSRRPTRRPTVPASVWFLRFAAGIAWIWAVTLLATRRHQVNSYEVLSPAPHAWGMLALPTAGLFLAILAGTLLVWSATGKAPLRWLLAAAVIPALDLLRLWGWLVPITFLEPLYLAALTGAAVSRIVAQHDAQPASPSKAKARQSLQRPTSWLTAVWGMAAVAAVWWYYLGLQAYDDFLLGHIDFGQYGVRVASTWEGWGFLIESPSLPAFWDHFNPGLALLAPLWGVWPDPRIFIVIQAVCLAAPAPIVWGIARRCGATGAGAASWAIAYLVCPAVGQLNLSYSYGWHPVSLALPLLCAALWALLRGWNVAALLTLLLACSLKENIPVVVACFALAMAFRRTILSRQATVRQTHSSQTHTSQTQAGDNAGQPLVARPSAWRWLALAGVLLAATFIISRLAPYSRFQMSKFGHLGGSTAEILLAPVVRPGVFWPTLLRQECGYYALALFVPCGLTALCRGWHVLLAVALPMTALMLMNLEASTSIAFQYSTTLLPILLFSALSGATAPTPWPFRKIASVPSSGQNSAQPRGRSRAQSLAATGWAAAAAGAIASASFGAVPWSSPTMDIMILQSYHSQDGPAQHLRRKSSAANAALQDLIRQVLSNRREVSVIATGRIAAHLIGARRLECVSLAQPGARWEALGDEAGDGRSPIEVFDYVVLDRLEKFQQSVELTHFFAEEARRAGYQQIDLGDEDLLVFRRP